MEFDKKTSEILSNNCRAWVELLEKNINGGQLIITNNSQMQTCKTTALIEVSKKYRIPIVMGIGSIIPTFKDKYNYENILSIDNVLEDNRNIPMEMLVNGVLIDEKVSSQQIWELKNKVEIRTGFYNDDCLIPTEIKLQKLIDM